MSNESKFLSAAVRETDANPEGYETWAAQGFAEGLLARGIGLLSKSSDEFVEAGLHYLDAFLDHAEAALDKADEMADENPDRADFYFAVKKSIEGYIQEVAAVDRSAFKDLLAEDWIETHDL